VTDFTHYAPIWCTTHIIDKG